MVLESCQSHLTNQNFAFLQADMSDGHPGHPNVRPKSIMAVSMDDTSPPAIQHSQSYILLQEIGKGAYGKVYRARENGGKERIVAVKRLNFCADPGGGIPAMMVREVGLLRRLEHFDHPNIVKLLETFAAYTGRNLDLTLVFEYIDQDLAVYIAKVPPIPQGLGLGKIKDLMVQLLQGLDFLHTNNVVHRDLKPENILVCSSGQIKIADFGLARIYTYNVALTPQVVTLWYRAPEVLLGSVYTSTVDMWSAGCILAELFILKPLFVGFSEAQQLHKIFAALGLPREQDWPMDSAVPYSTDWGPESPGAGLLPDLGQEGNDLLTECLTFKPTSRISASGALAHPFLNEIPWSSAPPQEPT